MYKAFLKDGDAFLKTAEGGKRRPKIFTSEIVYNVLAMSIEKYFMAMLIYKGDMADNHTFSDMIDSMHRHLTLDDDIVSGLKDLEEEQNICPIFEGYHRHEPDAEQLTLMYSINNRLKVMAHKMVAPDKPALSV